MRIVLLLVVLLSALPAGAQTVSDFFRSALALDDPLAVEAALIEARTASEAAGARADYWAQFHRSFDTTDPARIALIERWRAAAPDSPYAKLAEAVARIKLAGLIRGAQISRYVSNEAQGGFRAHMDAATSLTMEALGQDPGMVTGYYLLFAAYRTGARTLPLDTLTDRLLDLTPTRWALEAAVGALDPNWGGSLAAQVTMCETYAPRVPDYDAEACRLSTILSGHYPDDVVADARGRLDDRDEPWLDDLRYRVLMEYGGGGAPYDTDLANWLFDYHRKLFAGSANPVRWLEDGQRIAMNTEQPLYFAEVAERAEFAIPAAIRANPYDYRLITDYIRNALANEGIAGLSDDLRARLQQAWLGAMVYGRNDADLWLIGAQVFGDVSDPASAEPFVHNALVAGMGRPGVYFAVMQRYVGQKDRAERGVVHPEDWPADAPAPEDVIASLDCPMARIARLYLQACQTEAAGERGCQLREPTMQAAVAIDRQLEAGAICPEVAGRDVELLNYFGWEPVPMLDDFLASHPRGFE